MSRGAPLLALLLLLASGPVAPALAADDVADVCLALREDAVDATGWAAIREAVDAVVQARPSLFPDPSVVANDPGPQDPSAWRLDVTSGHAGLEKGAGPCLEPGHDWTARFERRFLEAAAERLLAEAPTTPGIASEVSLQWYPDELRVRTTLDFAGPLDIPNGTCWVDDTLAVDPVVGLVGASGEQGLQTSPFAEAACGRFFDHLPYGGAGEQAVTLLPAVIDLDDGTRLRFSAEQVGLDAEGITISGSLLRE